MTYKVSSRTLRLYTLTLIKRRQTQLLWLKQSRKYHKTTSWTEYLLSLVSSETARKCIQRKHTWSRSWKHRCAGRWRHIRQSVTAVTWPDIRQTTHVHARHCVYPMTDDVTGTGRRQWSGPRGPPMTRIESLGVEWTGGLLARQTEGQIQWGVVHENYL